MLHTCILYSTAEQIFMRLHQQWPWKNLNQSRSSLSHSRSILSYQPTHPCSQCWQQRRGQRPSCHQFSRHKTCQDQGTSIMVHQVQSWLTAMHSCLNDIKLSSPIPHKLHQTGFTLTPNDTSIKDTPLNIVSAIGLASLILDRTTEPRPSQEW